MQFIPKLYRGLQIILDLFWELSHLFPSKTFIYAAFTPAFFGAAQKNLTVDPLRNFWHYLQRMRFCSIPSYNWPQFPSKLLFRRVIHVCICRHFKFIKVQLNFAPNKEHIFSIILVLPIESSLPTWISFLPHLGKSTLFDDHWYRVCSRNSFFCRKQNP